MPPASDWDVWLLGTIGLRRTLAPPPPFASSSPHWVGVEDWWGTQAYMVTRRGATALLGHAYPMDAQIDAYMAHMAALGEVLVLTRSDIDIPQFPWYTTFYSTVQQTTSLSELLCDACSLPNGFSTVADDAFWVRAGAGSGFLCALLASRCIACIAARRFRANKSGGVGAAVCGDAGLPPSESNSHHTA